VASIPLHRLPCGVLQFCFRFAADAGDEELNSEGKARRVNGIHASEEVMHRLVKKQEERRSGKHWQDNQNWDDFLHARNGRLTRRAGTAANNPLSL